MVTFEIFISMALEDLDDANQWRLCKRLLHIQWLNIGCSGLHRHSVAKSYELPWFLGGGGFNKLREADRVAGFPVVKFLVRNPNASHLCPLCLARHARHHIHVKIAGI